MVESAAKDIWRKEKRNSHETWEEVEREYHFTAEVNVSQITVIEEAIFKLPFTYRQIFQLKYGWGYANREIADVLDMREGTIRQRLARGKKLLQELLEDAGVHMNG